MARSPSVAGDRKAAQARVANCTATGGSRAHACVAESSRNYSAGSLPRPPKRAMLVCAPDTDQGDALRGHTELGEAGEDLVIWSWS